MLQSPTSYQGAKQRIASSILDVILFSRPIESINSFCDLCCGSGAVSIEMIRRGFDARNIIMLDRSPWGLFWQHVGQGTFSTSKFKEHISSIPKDIKLIQSHIKGLSKLPADFDTVYIFLLLQASSFGGKSIWIDGNKWMNCSFRNYWLPTETSNRKSPVNPMMPMPHTLYDRVAKCCDDMLGVNGIYGDITDFQPNEDQLIYIDPPYAGTTDYGFTFDVMKYIHSNKNEIHVSEGMPLCDNATKISSGRKKGGISAARKNMNEEWLSHFHHLR